MQFGSDGYDVRPDLYAADTAVVTIPTKDSLLADTEAIWGRETAAELVESAADLTLNEMLGFQALYQQLWADNAVSFTANIEQGYPPESVAEQLKTFGGMLKGATIFPEASMPQAPYERLSREDYESATAKTVEDGVDLECSSGACPVR
jgi:ribonucleoside-triphosphate reductase